MIGTIEVIGDDTTALWLRSVAETAPARINPVITHFGAVLEMAIIAHSSGRPGPEIDTGFMHESWRVRFELVGKYLEAIVESTAPYVNRLEYGFAGRDSLGRVFHQPPFPFIGPSVDLVTPMFVEAIGGVVL